jgi:hypothetical protein
MLPLGCPVGKGKGPRPVDATRHVRIALAHYAAVCDLQQTQFMPGGIRVLEPGPELREGLCLVAKNITDSGFPAIQRRVPG